MTHRRLAPLLVAALMVICVGAASARSPAFSHPPRVIDGGGKAVGTVLDVETLLRREGTAVVALSFVGDYVVPQGFHQILFYYATSDCSGTPYMQGDTAI